MSAFLIVDTQIDNADKYEEYKKLAKPIAEKYGGNYRARGGAMDVLETDLWTPTRVGINPATKYAEFSQSVSARSKASERRFSHSKASFDNAAADRHTLA
jgi:uncharacterized protein (DUF1330 family)